LRTTAVDLYFDIDLEKKKENVLGCMDG